MNFGDRLRKLRKDRGLSGRELERRAGLPVGIVSRVERQEDTYPSVPSLKAIARVLGVTVDYLIGMYEEDDAPKQLTHAGAGLA